MIADHLGIDIRHLEVEVTGQVDCRGCLNIDDQVRVGFSGMDVQVRLEVAPGTDGNLVGLLQEMAERLCVNLDTLRHGVPVTVSFREPSALTSLHAHPKTDQADRILITRSVR